MRDAAVLDQGEAELTVCFIDIVGYTAQSRGLEGSELVSWVEHFEQETTLLVVDHGGQVIKTIGDEILFTVGGPAAAVEIALALTARGDDEDDPFPAVRVGIAHGPVVRRLGDVFGSTVNAACPAHVRGPPRHGGRRPGRPRRAGVRRRRGRRAALAQAAPGLAPRASPTSTRGASSRRADDS